MGKPLVPVAPTHLGHLGHPNLKTFRTLLSLMQESIRTSTGSESILNAHIWPSSTRWYTSYYLDWDDLVAMISAIDGTLGLCIGFSFRDLCGKDQVPKQRKKRWKHTVF